MKAFNYHRPSNLGEVSQLLADLGEDAQVLAGGTALMLVMRQRMLNPLHLISLENLAVLKDIRIDAQTGVSIGALCTHSDIAHSGVVNRYFPIMVSMAGRVANPQVRNQGTLGGNICYADPSTDPTTCLLSLNARVVLANQHRVREIPLDAFLIDYFTTDLQSDELLVAVNIPLPNPTYEGFYYRHLKTQADHRPIFNCSLMVDHSNDECADLRIAVGAALPVAKRIPEIESLLKGQVITSSLIDQACEMLIDNHDFISDFRADDHYRQTIARTTLKRALITIFS